MLIKKTIELEVTDYSQGNEKMNAICDMIENVTHEDLLYFAALVKRKKRTNWKAKIQPYESFV